MCNGSNWGFSFLIMTYNILIDQRFAVANELTIVQTTTLAACMTLPTWTNTITVDGIVWYQYSETKMVDDFPLLFSIPKRVYKNIKELADRGFIELSSFGKTKYLRFTEKCKTWNRSETEFNQSENGLQDYNINIQQSENGLNNSPKTEFNQSENGLQDYNINNNNINNTMEKEAKASKDFGFTPELLDVKKQVIDKVDNYFAKLIFPFDSVDFKRNFYILMCQPKWRTSQKSFSAIQANLKGWAALEYDSTPEKYEKWERMKRSVKTEQQSKKEYEDMMKYLNNDFD